MQEQQQRLVEAETLAVVGDLSAAVAHRIRNPLVSIRTSAEQQRELTGDTDGVQGETMRKRPLRIETPRTQQQSDQILAAGSAIDSKATQIVELHALYMLDVICSEFP